LISVAICTFNRAESLRRTIATFAAMELPTQLRWELIVVDNNSKDHTHSVVKTFEQILPVRYVFEAEQGLSAARNRATREFAGDVLLFTDDDVELDSSWLGAYARALNKFPLAGYFGGRVVPSWPDGKPGWAKDESLALISGVLVRFHLGSDTRELMVNDPSPFGASFGLRRSVLDAIGQFRLDLGVNGGVPGRGEEADYLDRVRDAGWAGVYVGEAIVHHLTDLRRLTLSYLFQYGVQTGISARRMGSKESGSTFRVAIFAFRAVAQLLRGRGDRFRQCVINMGIQIALRDTPTTPHPLK